MSSRKIAGGHHFDLYNLQCSLHHVRVQAVHLPPVVLQLSVADLPGFLLVQYENLAAVARWIFQLCATNQGFQLHARRQGVHAPPVLAKVRLVAPMGEGGVAQGVVQVELFVELQFVDGRPHGLGGVLVKAAGVVKDGGVGRELDMAGLDRVPG